MSICRASGKHSDLAAAFDQTSERQEGFGRLDTSNSQYSVTFCITELDVGGAEKALVRIAIGLQQRGWTVRVISLRDSGPMTASLEDAGISVTSLNCGSFADVRSYFRLKTAIQTSKLDVLVCFLHQANIYGRLVAHRLKIPVISGVRVADRRKWIVWTERLTKSYVTHYIAVSKHVAETHSRLCGIQSDRISSISNGVDAIAVKTPRTEDDGTGEAHYQILFVGRLTRQKAPMDLLSAFNALPANLRATSSLTFAGEGELAGQIEATVLRLGLTNKVNLIGQCDDPVALMAESTLLVLPSLWEGMPNVVLEAMAAGLPVVATDVDGTRELIDHRINGWLVAPGQPAELCTAIQEALENRQQRLRFAAVSQVLAVERFSWNQACQAYHERLTLVIGAACSKTAR